MRKKLNIPLYQKLKEENFVVLDIETTGFHPEKHAKIIEIGALKIKKGRFVEQFQVLIDPEIPIPSKVTDVTHITNEMVEGAPIYEEVLPYLYDFIEDCVVVCHNTPFDWNRFLLHYFKTLSLHPAHATLDTMTLFKKVYPQTNGKNLKIMSETMGITLEGHHRAVNDALVTAKCFLKLRETLLNEMERDFGTQLQFIERLEKPITPCYPTPQTVVVSANYWEKAVTKTTHYRRIYVSLREGDIFGKLYYDCNRQRWYNEDFPYNLNFSGVEQLVKQRLNVADLNDVPAQSQVS